MDLGQHGGRLAVLLGLHPDVPQPLRRGLRLQDERFPDNQSLLQPLRTDEEGPDGEKYEEVQEGLGAGGQSLGREERSGTVSLLGLHTHNVHLARG